MSGFSKLDLFTAELAVGSPVVDTWYTVLDLDEGTPGHLLRFRAMRNRPGESEADDGDMEARLTFNGELAPEILGFTSNNISSNMLRIHWVTPGAAKTQARWIPSQNLEFATSIKFEIRITSSFGGTLRARLLYAK